MRLFEFFRNKKDKTPETAAFVFLYRGSPVEVEVEVTDAESRRQLAEDAAVLTAEGLEAVVRSRFLPWFKGESFSDRDDDRILAGLGMTGGRYTYGRIIEKYAPNGQEGYFGQFEFDFVSTDAYTADMLEATAMEVFVQDGRIVNVSGYEI